MTNRLLHDIMFTSDMDTMTERMEKSWHSKNVPNAVSSCPPKLGSAFIAATSPRRSFPAQTAKIIPPAAPPTGCVPPFGWS